MVGQASIRCFNNSSVTYLSRKLVFFNIFLMAHLKVMSSDGSSWRHVGILISRGDVFFSLNKLPFHIVYMVNFASLQLFILGINTNLNNIYHIHFK